MKIILADDHALFRAGLRHVLSTLDSEVSVIEAADFAQLTSCAGAHPDTDLVLVDLNMPGDEPFACLSELLEHHPTLLIVVLTASEEFSDMRRALDLGVMGFIPKREEASIMLNALRLVLSGGIYFPPSMMRRIGEENENPRSLSLLTPRQIDVLREMLNGLGNKEIGLRLNMSEATVKAHLSAIFRTLNVINRTQAALAARELGFVQSVS